MADPWPDYVSMVSGLSKATRARARAAAWALLSQAGLDEQARDATDRITRLADEITAASRANRVLLENLVTAEVDKTATRLGFVRAADLSDIRAEIAALRAQLTVVTAAASDPARSEPARPAEATPTVPSPAQKAPAQKAPAKKAPAQKAPAKNAATATAPAKKTPTKRSPAKTGVKKAAVKKASVAQAGTSDAGPTESDA